MNLKSKKINDPRPSASGLQSSRPLSSVHAHRKAESTPLFRNLDAEDTEDEDREEQIRCHRSSSIRAHTHKATTSTSTKGAAKPHTSRPRRAICLTLGARRRNERQRHLYPTAIEDAKKSAVKAPASIPLATATDKSSKKKRTRPEQSDEPEISDDLSQNLNIDAFRQPSSEKQAVEKRRQRLKQMRRARRKRLRSQLNYPGDSTEEDDAEEETGSDDHDPGSPISSVPSSSSAFIVDDEDSSPARGADVAYYVRKSVHLHGRTLSSVNIRSARLTMMEKCDEYAKWLLVIALDLDKGVSKERMQELTDVRDDLRQEMRMEYAQLTSQSTRRQFRWYLAHYPYFLKHLYRGTSFEDHHGCAACHRQTQKCEFSICFWGRFYNAETLEWRDSESSTESEISTDNEDAKNTEQNAAGKDFHTFHLGANCAQKAVIMHKLLHWERHALRDMTKLQSYRSLRRRQRRADDNAAGMIKPGEIDSVVREYRVPLLRFLRRLKKMAEDVRMLRAPVRRESESWDDPI